MSNPLVAKLKNGRRVYGTMVTSTSPHAVGVVASLGLDFVFIDTEHISLNRESLSWLCRLFAAQNVLPIVRIPSPDPHVARMALDGGAEGVVAPYVETVDEVKALCGAVKQRPLKGGRLESILAGEQVPEGTARYLRDYSRDRLLLINVESRLAMNRLDDLLSVPGLDGVVVGPHDLSVSLDLPEQYRSDAYLQAVKSIARRARSRVAISGVHFMDVGSVDEARSWMGFGFNFLILHADLVYVKRGLHHDLRVLRDGREGSGGPDEARIHV